MFTSHILVFLCSAVCLCHPYKVSPAANSVRQRCDTKNISIPRGCGVIPSVNRGLVPTGIAAFGEFPWQVALVDVMQSSFVCSGALIGRRTVLTAASCVHNVTLADLHARVGDWDVKTSYNPLEVFHSYDLAVSKKIYTTAFMPPRHEGLALLKLKEAVNFDMLPHVGRVCLPPSGTPQFLSAELCYVAGWATADQPTNWTRTLLPDDPSCPAEESDFECDTDTEATDSSDEAVISRYLGKARVRLVGPEECQRLANLSNTTISLQSDELCLLGNGAEQPCSADVGSVVSCDLTTKKSSATNSRLTALAVVTDTNYCGQNFAPVIATGIFGMLPLICRIVTETK